MVVSNMRSWMVMFALDLTNVHPDDVSKRSSIISQYKQSALKCGIGERNNPTSIANDVLGGDGKWIDPNICLVIGNNEPVPHGKWQKPRGDSELSNDKSQIYGCWVAPDSPVVIDNSESSPNGKWVSPNDAMEVGVSEEPHMGTWTLPTL